mmetsp:Transcript_47798/g.154024  ORF Transcript_47798/g.154024 Transcript_47798/m.154024 type:complete len:262 (-) Transcript_47798:520-1305(-)
MHHQVHAGVAAALVPRRARRCQVSSACASIAAVLHQHLLCRHPALSINIAVAMQMEIVPDNSEGARHTSGQVSLPTVASAQQRGSQPITFSESKSTGSLAAGSPAAGPSQRIKDRRGEHCQRGKHRAEETDSAPGAHEKHRYRQPSRLHGACSRANADTAAATGGRAAEREVGDRLSSLQVAAESHLQVDLGLGHRSPVREVQQLEGAVAEQQADVSVAERMPSRLHEVHSFPGRLQRHSPCSGRSGTGTSRGAATAWGHW